MATDRAPAFQLYARDFVSDEHVVLMTCAEVGAYIRLLCYCWLEGSLPSEERALAVLAGASVRDWARLSPSVLARFYQRDGRYWHGRLEAERANQEERRRASCEHGASGARGRWGQKKTDADAMPEQCPSNARAMPNDGSASASASAVQKERTSDGFAVFYAAYPKHVAKKDAEKAWHALAPTDTLQATILADVTARAATPDWTKEHGKYVPLPATYLRGRRWEDEATTPPVADSGHWYDACPHDPKCERMTDCQIKTAKEMET